jgi:hypothetical protein
MDLHGLLQDNILASMAELRQATEYLRIISVQNEIRTEHSE